MNYVLLSVLIVENRQLDVFTRPPAVFLAFANGFEISVSLVHQSSTFWLYFTFLNFYIDPIAGANDPPAVTAVIKQRSAPTFYSHDLLPVLTCPHLDLLVRAVDHGDEHVEQDHHHSDVVDAVQHVADVLYKLVVVLEHH